jgi:hypothetical protein
MTSQKIDLSSWDIMYIVTYLLKARTVKTKKQLLLSNDPYTQSSGGARHLRCDFTQH